MEKCRNRVKESVERRLAYVASYETGVRVLDVSRPALPVEVGSFGISGGASGIWRGWAGADPDRPLIYVSHRSEGFFILRYTGVPPARRRLLPALRVP